MCCPKTSRHESDVGCASTNIIEDPSDPGTFDCLDCGIFFSQEAAEYVEQGKQREGKPSPRFGARGLHNINLGGGSTPLLIKLYGPNDDVLATLTEEKGECIDPGYVDFFLGPNCRPAKHQRYLVEKLPDGTVGVLHDQPQVLARNFDAWVAFLDKWISRHEDTPSRGVVL